jgi:HK97 family phage prohead protease
MSKKNRVVELKAYPIRSKSIEGRVVKQLFAVMGNVDHGNDVIWNGAFTKTLQENFDMVQALWQHDTYAPPVGVPQVLKELGRADLPSELLLKTPEATGALYGEIKYLETDRGNEVFTGIVEGAIKQNSIGFYTIKSDYSQLGDVMIRNLRELQLMDVSPVNWGMNDSTMNMKAALPYRDTGIADADTAWAAPGLKDFTEGDFDALEAKELKRIMSHYAWTANTPPESFGDLKLGHHAPDAKGTGPAVWKAVAAAMSALMGEDSGIPDDDRKDVYDHLAGHYEQFSKTAPDFKFVEACYYATKLKGFHVELKEGRMFSSENLDKLNVAVATLKDATGSIEQLIAKATPAKGVDVSALVRRARSLELAIALH